MNAKREHSSEKGTCSGRFSDHRWTLCIEEAKPHLWATPCGEGCTVSEYGVGDSYDWLTMEEIQVTVQMATDCPAYDTDEHAVPTGPAKPMRGYESGSHYIAHGTRCDCNWWPVAVPLSGREQPS